jgi:hypothetical protein
MSSASTKNRLRLASEIQHNGRPVDIPCDYCFLSGHTCIAMANASHLHCSECVRLGRPCVNLSWDSLDRTREEYQRKVDEDEVELSVILARLMRNKKILRQAEHRAERKALCLSNEMEAASELESVDNYPAADAGTSVSPAVWSTINFLDEAVTSLLDPAPYASVSDETRQSASVN